MKELIKIDGVLQLWIYDVGHSRLLFRRPKDANSAEQIDVLFKNVSYIRCETLISRCLVAELNLTEIDLEISPMVKGGRKAFQLAGAEGNNFVIAGACEWKSTSQDYFEESPLMEHG